MTLIELYVLQNCDEVEPLIEQMADNAGCGGCIPHGSGSRGRGRGRSAPTSTPTTTTSSHPDGPFGSSRATQFRHGVGSSTTAPSPTVVPPTPSTPASSVQQTVGGQAMGSRVTTGTDMRIWIRPYANKDFYPLDGPHKTISTVVKGHYTGTWPTWTKIRSTVRDHWFEHLFGATNRWRPEDEALIRAAFEHRGSLVVKNFMEKIRDGSSLGDFLTPEVLEDLRQHWATDREFLERSVVGKQNQAADTGAPLSTDGSVPITKHHVRLTNEMQRLPTAYEVLKVSKKSKSREWVENAGEIVDRFHCRRDEAISQGQEPSLASNNAIFLEVVGGRNKKGHVYGLGALGDEYVASATPSSQSCHGSTPDVRGLVFDLNVRLVSQLVERVAALEMEMEMLYKHLGFKPDGSGSIPEDAAASGTRADAPTALDDRSFLMPLASSMMQMIMRLMNIGPPHPHHPVDL